MKTLAFLVALAFATATATVQAQSYSYDFTLTGVGINSSGTFTDSTFDTNPNDTFFPIGSLTGTINGQAMSLLSVPVSIGNRFSTTSLGIAPFYPLFFQSGGTEWVLSHEDNHGPTMLGNSALHIDEAVNFIVTPTPTRHTPILSSGTFTFAKPTHAVTPRNSYWQIGIDVPAATAVIVGFIYWEKHRGREHAKYTGRVR